MLLYLSGHHRKDPFVEHPVCGCEGPSSSNLNSNDSFLRATAVFVFVKILLVSVLLRIVSNNQMNLSAGSKKSPFIQNKLQWRFIWRFLTCFLFFFINYNVYKYKQQQLLCRDIFASDWEKWKCFLDLKNAH